jgi:hypothetical protein
MLPLAIGPANGLHHWFGTLDDVPSSLFVKKRKQVV